MADDRETRNPRIVGRRSIFDDPYDPPGWSAGRKFAPSVKPKRAPDIENSASSILQRAFGRDRQG